MVGCLMTRSHDWHQCSELELAPRYRPNRREGGPWRAKPGSRRSPRRGARMLAVRWARRSAPVRGGGMRICPEVSMTVQADERTRALGPANRGGERPAARAGGPLRRARPGRLSGLGGRALARRCAGLSRGTVLERRRRRRVRLGDMAERSCPVNVGRFTGGKKSLRRGRGSPPAGAAGRRRPRSAGARGSGRRGGARRGGRPASAG